MRKQAQGLLPMLLSWTPPSKVLHLFVKLILNMKRGSGQVRGHWGAARVTPGRWGHPPWSHEGLACLQGAASGLPLGGPVTCPQCSAPVLCVAGLPGDPEQGQV